ncbi:MAG: 50S ribosomal protein L28 [Candidatus Gracilibacteria bacterium]|jgi:large subunit ribosomal protein L28
MSKVCQITGKKPSYGQQRSHAMNASKRRFLPNLVSKKVLNPKTGRVERMKVSTNALRTLVKRKGK